ncbi:1-phosphatidylinositol 4,5-bisphosphate phosphodiesterase delta-1 [Coemansia sp. RSA 1200]|nr:1-phosphatidylinositol 4,5-bisphosphate phosphodiesterase delta-1 [Coemansia sp. RSA 1200]
MAERIHSQLDDFNHNIVRHRYSISSFCSNESTSSNGSTISNSNDDRHAPFSSTSNADTSAVAAPGLANTGADAGAGASTALEHDHDPTNCLSCTRRNVISVFPRFRKVSNRLLSSFRSPQQRPSATCPAEKLASKNRDNSVSDNIIYPTPHSRPGPTVASSDTSQKNCVLPLQHPYSPLIPLHVYPAHPARAALCLGVRGASPSSDSPLSVSDAIGAKPAPASADQQSSSSVAGRNSGCGGFVPLPTIPERLAKGCPLLKTTSRGAHIRDFRLDIAQQRITWNSPKKKKLAHIDLERIVEIRVGQSALWAVADEDCLPNGSKRLFAIVFYNQMELKTICVAAQSESDFQAWVGTLTYLLSSRQPIASTSQFQRWQMVMLCRQWWMSDQSNQSATDALQRVEAVVGDKNSYHTASNAAMSYPLPISRASHVQPDQLLDELTMLRALSPPKSTSMRKWLSGSGSGSLKSPSLVSIMTYNSLSTPTTLQQNPQQIRQQLEEILRPQQQQLQQQQVGCDDWVLGTVESIYAEHSQQSTNTLYEEISLSFVNSVATQTPSARISGCSVFDAQSDSDSSDIDSSDIDNDNDRLTMSGSARRSRKPRMSFRLEMPKERRLGLTLSVFGRFLREVQKEDVDNAEVERRFLAFVPAGAEVMSAYGLEAYLLSEFNQFDYMPPATSSVGPEDSNASAKIPTDPNMDLPLNQYYVSTSHNTYLTGDQLVGTAAVESYVHALLRGCRCLELDCWDGRFGEPVVCHGHTFTTRILFEDVIIAISRYAFATSPYPVILSFETHCSLPQQARMAAILKKYLGKMMVLEPVDGEHESKLPSPNQLKHRIIVKNKVLEPPKSRRSTVTGAHSRSKSVWPAQKQGTAKQQERRVSPRTSNVQIKRKVAPELSDLIVYCKAVHFEGFEGVEGPEPAFDQVTSLSESSSNQLMRQNPQKYADYNAIQMTRVYPSFSRFTSTNFNPISHWASGCQLVALNFQTLDRNMQVYDSMFHSTPGGTGYVPKPNHLREPKKLNASSFENDEDKEPQYQQVYTETQLGEDRLFGKHEDGTTTTLSPPQSQGTMNSPSLKYATSWDSSLSSPGETDDSTASVSSPSPPASSSRRTTVHISVISAHNVAMEAASISRVDDRSSISLRVSNNYNNGGGRRGSFSTELGGGSHHIPLYNSNNSPSSHTPHRLSPSPSDVAMFANNNPQPAPEQAPFSADYSLLNAAATVAAADAVASLAALQQQSQKPTSDASSSSSSSTQGANLSRVRVEVEWISEGAAGGQQRSGSNRQSTDDSAAQQALAGGGSKGNIIAGLQHQQHQTPSGGLAMLGGLSAIHSLHGTAANSPILQPQQQQLTSTGYPFVAVMGGVNGSSLVTPLNAPPPAPTPLAYSSTSVLNKGRSSKSRYVTRNGTVRGTEIWWKDDESLFRVVNDPEISFMRVSLVDDDVEVASACVSVSSLKEGYRYVELCETEKSKGTSLCRPVQVLVHVQMSQLHCLAIPTMRI